MMTWGEGLPMTREERRRRSNVLMVGLITLLAVVGTYRAGQVSAHEELVAKADSLETYKLAVETLREREELSVAYLAEHHPAVARELRNRTRLWGDLP